jgi:3-dehydroquinate dehydratase
MRRDFYWERLSAFSGMEVSILACFNRDSFRERAYISGKMVGSIMDSGS